MHPTPLPAGGTLDYLTTRDGIRVRYGFWRNSDQAKESILLLPGRTEFIEKYAQVILELQDRGYQVLCLDWPNQGMSDRPLPNRFKHHLDRFEVMLHALEDVVERVMLPTFGDGFDLLAHSMGGHMALRYLKDNQRHVRRAVLSAPMVDIHFGALPRPLARGLIHLAPMLGLRTAYALGQVDRLPVAAHKKMYGLLTSDPTRREEEEALLAANEDLRLGGVTWGWLQAAAHSSDMLLSPGFPEAIATPTQFIQGGQDRVIDNDAMERFAGRMPNARVHRIEPALHEIMREVEDLRSEFWGVFDQFMAQNRR